MEMNRLVPELDVSNLDRSLEFYLKIIGCKLLYQRPEEKFAFLDHEGAQLMIEEAAGPGRRFRTAPLEYPFGRGFNLQIRTANVDALYERCQSAGSTIVIPLEEQWYRKDNVELGNRQFIVADPDGFLLRFYSNLGARAASLATT